MTETSDIVYTATVRAENGRGGQAQSLTGSLEVTLTRPADRGTDKGTDPEELFAAGYAACFDSALAVVARREKVKIGTTHTTVSVNLHAGEGANYYISASIHVDAPECDADELERLVELANQTCPYSKATAGNISRTLTSTGK